MNGGLAASPWLCELLFFLGLLERVDALLDLLALLAEDIALGEMGRRGLWLPKDE